MATRSPGDIALGNHFGLGLAELRTGPFAREPAPATHARAHLHFVAQRERRDADAVGLTVAVATPPPKGRHARGEAVRFLTTGSRV